MVKSTIAAIPATDLNLGMSEDGKEVSVKEEVAIETQKLVAAGVPEFLASIQGAGIVHTRHQVLERRRLDAMATSCNEA